MGQKPKSKRKRIGLAEFMARFGTEEKAREYLEGYIWKNGRHCSRCGSTETREASHKYMPYWCKSCRKYFSVKTGTLMEGSNITYRNWVMAIYLMGTSLKGVSSTKLANDLNIQQRSAWFLAHRIRKAWANNASELFGQVVEIDEAYLGGLEKNKHKDKKIKKGQQFPLRAYRAVVSKQTSVFVILSVFGATDFARETVFLPCKDRFQTIFFTHINPRAHLSHICQSKFPSISRMRRLYFLIM